MSFSGRSAGLAIGPVALALGFGLLAGPTLRAMAQDAGAAQTVIPQVNFADADLRGAINALRQQYGIDVVLEQPGDAPYGPVNVSLANKSVDFVLRRIAASAGASVRVEDGVYYVGPLGAAKTLPVEQPAPAPAPAPQEQPHGHLRYEHIHLVNARASDIRDLLYGQYSPVMANSMLTAAYGGVPSMNPLGAFKGASLPTVLSPATYGANGPIPGAAANPSVPPVVPLDHPNAQPGEGQTPGSHEEGQFGGGIGGGRGGGIGGDIGGGIGGGRGGGIGGGVGGPGGAGGGANAASLLPPGVTNVFAYDVDNSLIVTYDPTQNPDAIRDFKTIVGYLDIAPKQLMIKAEFIQVQQDDIRSFGIDWNVSRGALTATTGQNATGQVQVNWATGNLVAALRASLVEGRGRIVNSPMATTTNNVPVTLQISTTVPVITNSVAFGQGGQGITIPTITPVQVSSGISAMPRINGDNTITMFVVPFVQDILSEVANPAGGTIPIITSQFVPVVRRIGNGETMVIGGLIKKNDRTSTSKVPLFGDLPLIGSLFQSRSTTVQDSELLVFVTPTILPDPVGTAAPATAGVQPRP